jgi:hypothetical protein
MGDFIHENARMAVAAGAFGMTGETFFPPLAPHPVPVTPRRYAEAVIVFWQDNMAGIFRALRVQVQMVQLDGRLLAEVESTQAGGGPLMVAEWERLLEKYSAFRGGIIHRTITDIAHGSRLALQAFARGVVGAVPDNEGFGENLAPGEAAAFWSAWAKVAIAAEQASAEILKNSLTDALIESAKERAAEAGEFVGEALVKTGEVAGDVLRTAGEIAGEGLGGVLSGLGIVPIAIGVAAVYVGVKVL